MMLPDPYFTDLMWRVVDNQPECCDYFHNLSGWTRHSVLTINPTLERLVLWINLGYVPPETPASPTLNGA